MQLLKLGQFGLLLPLLAAGADPAVHPLTGRPIAGVMGAGGAHWLERSERESEEQPQLAVRLLQLQPGMRVADVGAGSGYYTELLSRAVGASGAVLATDIQPAMLRLIDKRVKDKALTNVQTILASDSDPRLPANSLDLILLVDVYHEFSQPQAMLRRLRAALKPSGRLVLLEFRKEDPQVPIRPEHKMSVADVRTELEAEGLRFHQVLNDLPWQHILVFLK
ncbi:MAG: methyltransferase domain-containing protein [Acidobacteria bacterium]|nr:methyltransferase domain-containing protein [Acidobacteriota bacterium]